jgi:hypothetical protein
MPQFDFFIWFSLSFWTIFTFQILYYFLLYFIISPFSNIQKTLIKLYKSQIFIFDNKINLKLLILNSILRKLYNF